MVLSVLFLAWWVQKPGDKRDRIVVRGLAFSTVYQVSVVQKKMSPDLRDRSLKGVEKSIRAIVQRETEFVDTLMSRYREDSALSRLNRHKDGTPFPVGEHLAELLASALQVSQLTEGAFDITVGPLLRLWGFDKKKKPGQLPTAEEIGLALKKTGYRNLVVDPEPAVATKKIPDLDLDLSAIAKGYAVDRIAWALTEAGFKNYLVEIGGEVRAKGTNDRGVSWRVGVETPLSERRQTFQIIELKNRSVATSGDYRNFFVFDGRRFSHTIDPRSGRPVSHGLASVTVVHQRCALADALATGLTVLGPEKGYQLAEQQGLPALFITRATDGNLVDRATREFLALAVSKKSTSHAPPEGDNL